MVRFTGSAGIHGNKTVQVRYKTVYFFFWEHKRNGILIDLLINAIDKKYCTTTKQIT